MEIPFGTRRRKLGNPVGKTNFVSFTEIDVQYIQKSFRNPEKFLRVTSTFLSSEPLYYDSNLSQLASSRHSACHVPTKKPPHPDFEPATIPNKNVSQAPPTSRGYTLNYLLGLVSNELSWLKKPGVFGYAKCIRSSGASRCYQFINIIHY
jgi:hypothetical protein